MDIDNAAMNIIKVYIAQMNSAMKISKIICEHEGTDELTANAMAIWTRVTSKLERGAGNIRSCYVKTSMGPSVKVDVIE